MEKHFKTLAAMIFFCAVLAFPPDTGAKMFVETFLASGQIVVVRGDIITLDDGYTYHPAKPGQDLHAAAGQMVTLRYLVGPDEQRMYSVVAPGKNSLKAIPVPEDTRRPKSSL